MKNEMNVLERLQIAAKHESSKLNGGCGVWEGGGDKEVKLYWQVGK